MTSTEWKVLTTDGIEAFMEAKGYVTVQAMADKWDILVDTLRKYIKHGLIKGVLKIGRKYYIPANTEKPKRKPRVKKEEDLND